jgi:hypothetical protein
VPHHGDPHTLAPSGQGTVVLNIGRDVRARYVRGGVRWSVVIDGLPAGRYSVWRDPVTVLDEVNVSGGTVTEYEWAVPVAV